jgi:hypothetical protein
MSSDTESGIVRVASGSETVGSTIGETLGKGALTAAWAVAVYKQTVLGWSLKQQ